MRFAENARSFCRHAGLGAALLSTLTNLVSPLLATWASPGRMFALQIGTDGGPS